MARLSGQDVLQVLLIGIGVLILAGFLIKTVGIGDNFDLSKLGEVSESTFIFELIVAIVIVFFITIIMKKLDAGNLSGKSLVTLLILGFVLYYSIKFLGQLGFVDVDLPFAVLSQSVMS